MVNINELLEQLTLEEKACLLSGHKSWHSVAIPRLNIPSIFITDGPHGLRKKKEDSKETFESIHQKCGEKQSRSEF